MAIERVYGEDGANPKVAVLIVEQPGGKKLVQLTFADRADTVSMTVTIQGDAAKALGATIAQAGVQCEGRVALIDTGLSLRRQ